MSFLHLNCHSDRSIGRGMIRPSKLASVYAERSVGAACITDYGNMSAAVQLNNACITNDLQPVFGMEVNLVPDRKDKKPGYQSLVLLAKNRTGFFNLVKLATIGAMYFYYVPRVDFDIISQHAEGLIASTSDINGVAAHAFFARKHDGIAALYEQYGDVFGDDLYWEIQPVPTESQRVFNEALVECAYGVDSMRLLATGDPHYLNKQDAELHQNFCRIKNFRNPGWEYPFKGDYHVRTREEMQTGFDELHGVGMEGITEALDQPQRILETIESFDLREGTKVPSYEV